MQGKNGESPAYTTWNFAKGSMLLTCYYSHRVSLILDMVFDVVVVVQEHFMRPYRVYRCRIVLLLNKQLRPASSIGRAWDF